MKYKQVRDGEWIKPAMTGYVHECCQCGTMHKMDFRVESDGVNIEMRGTRLTDKEAADIRAKLERPPAAPLRDSPDVWRSRHE